MLFNSVQFLFFFPIVTLVYYLLPKRYAYIWLLIASYYFYMCWNASYAVLIMLSTLVTYASGLLIDRFNMIEDGLKSRKFKKACVAFSFLINIGILAFFKYIHFATHSAVIAFGAIGIQLNPPTFDILLPVGISFYTFQALSYTMDVYRGEVGAERNILKYALFVSFFPQLVAGPIERSKNLLKQVDRDRVPFNVNEVRSGLLVMAWGLFMKVVIADNIASIVDPVFDGYMNYDGAQICLACILFAFQIYCDFNGYTKIAIGAAHVLGFSLMENFNTPYLATSIKDFWKRWHISLTSWFRDYLYIPLGGNRKGLLRKYVNIMIVFLVSGLWHGASWHYVIWGGLNGAYQIIGEVTKPLRQKVCNALCVDTTRFAWRIARVAITFVLVDFSWLLFRADSMGTAIDMMSRIISCFSFHQLLSSELIGLLGSGWEVIVLLAALAALFAVDIAKYRGIDLVQTVLRQQIVFRWAIYLILVFVIIIWGAYGAGHEQVQFIYFQF